MENIVKEFYCTIMSPSAMLQIPKLRFSEPRQNLPIKSAKATAERNFTLKFARAYIAQFEALHHRTNKTEVEFAREIPMNSFGIADFVVVSWDPHNLHKNQHVIDAANFIRLASPTVRAFELKMANWRRALIQAHRYRYFANASIVVLPSDRLKRASMYLTTFKAINVGLWSFNPMTNCIKPVFTPRPTNPLEPKYMPRAIELIAKASKSQLLA